MDVKRTREKTSWVIYTRSDQTQSVGSKRFTSQDGYKPTCIEIGVLSPHWKMDYCHEVAHVLISYLDNWDKESDFRTYKKELTAWRVAKTFCKPEYWSDDRALRGLHSYVLGFRGYSFLAIHEKIVKIGIIPLHLKKLDIE